MSLRNIIVASLLSLPSLGKAEEQNHHQPPSHLALNFGYSLSTDDVFRRASASAYVNGLLMTFGYREKTNIPEQPGSLEAGGLKFEGIERKELHEFDFSFGLEIYQWERQYIDLTCFGEVTGGIQEGITKLRTETGTIPGAPSIDFLLGGGIRAEAVFRIPQKYTIIPVGIGLGMSTEYLNEQIEDIEENQLKKFQLGGYALVRFVKGKR